MNKSSYFIPDKALFGSYPDADAVKELEDNGVVLFINLTEEHEINSRLKYKVSKNSKIISYPIADRKIPNNYLSFVLLIVRINNLINTFKPGEKLYVHCKGGHGRAGVLVACLLCYIYSLEPNYALKLTTQYHSTRKEMKQKWRQIGSPQTNRQKSFVIRMFTPTKFYKAYKSGSTTGFSNFSTHPVYMKCFDETFPTSEAAFNAFKDPNNSKYIQKLVEAKSPFIAKEHSKTCNLRTDWFQNREQFMLDVIRAKVQQHDDFKTNLINSGLKPIIHFTQNDKFWGNGPEDNGKNVLGSILMKVRNEIFNQFLVQNEDNITHNNTHNNT